MSSVTFSALNTLTLMSSASFGTRNLDPSLTSWVGSPVFSDNPPAGWPNPKANGSMGPAPAAAHLHQWDERMFPAGAVIARPYPTQGQAERIRLVSTGRNAVGPSLLMLRPNGHDLDAEGRGRVYVEYRGRDGWDRGLHESGTDLARRAVVVHTRTYVSGDGVLTWYRGRVLVPTETDTDVAPGFTPLVVRVTWVADDKTAVEVEVTTSAEREIEIERAVFTSELAMNNGETRITPCGDEIVWAQRTIQTTTHFIPSSRGFGGTGEPRVASPIIAWTVGGVLVPQVAGWGSLEVPTSEGSFTVEYDLTLDPARLVLVSRGGERYETEVRATATEPGGAFGHFAIAAFDPRGWTEGLSAEDVEKLARCLRSRLGRVGIRDRDWLLPVFPEHPDWGRFNEHINIARINELANRLRAVSPGVAADLTKIAELRGEHIGQFG
jgi:hypothetical protein